MVTLLQKRDVEVHLSNKEMGSWLSLLLTRCVKPVSCCQVKTSANKLNLSVNWAPFFLSMWTNNLSGNSTIDQITTKLLMQNEKKSPVAHLRATLCQ